MAVTKHECMTAGHRAVLHEYHEPGARPVRWYVNGMCKTWKTRPDEFRLPVKHGLRTYDYVTQYNAPAMHWEKDCPDGMGHGLS